MPRDPSPALHTSLRFGSATPSLRLALGLYRGVPVIAGLAVLACSSGEDPTKTSGTPSGTSAGGQGESGGSGDGESGGGSSGAQPGADGSGGSGSGGGSATAGTGGTVLEPQPGCDEPSCGPEFAAPFDLANNTVEGVSSLDAGDINGDGRPDVLLAEGGKHAGGRETFAWYEAPTAPGMSWTRHDIIHEASLGPFLGSVALGDIDGDGWLDIVLSSDNHSGGTKAAEVFVFLNPKEAGKAWPHHTLNASTLSVHHINDMVLSDLDQDGSLDVVVRSLEPNQIHLFFQNTPASWQRDAIDTGLAESEGLAVGDIDGEFGPDITFTGYFLQASSDPRSDGYTKRPIDTGYSSVNQNTKEFVADIDGDGHADVVLGPAEAYRGGDDHDLAWYKNPGSNYTSEWEKHVIESGTNDSHTVKGGDIDGDGDVDVIVGRPWGETGIYIWFNDGSGVFSGPATIEEEHGLYSGVVLDMDGDGDQDIVGQDRYAGSSAPYLYENLLVP